MFIRPRWAPQVIRSTRICLNSAALPAVFAANGSYLLPQAFAEGCPLHPSYPAGHATVAGACSAMLKAFFDETQLVTDTVQASADGLSLTPLTNIALTVGGEIDKLAFNIAMGRNFGGIHYRSDAENGFLLGEEVAIAMLQDLVNTCTETYPGSNSPAWMAPQSPSPTLPPVPLNPCSSMRIRKCTKPAAPKPRSRIFNYIFALFARTSSPNPKVSNSCDLP